MAPKRKSKNTKTLKLLDYKALVLNDVLCPICRSILIEPVTLPCNHVFCSACFDGTMESANLVCPLCRIRVGSWLRKAKKERKLINYELWKVIENQFPQQVQNKLNGVDENLEEEPQIIVSYPGEIRKEYEVQKQKEDEEVKKRRAEEDKASEELIRKLKDQEDYERAAKEEKLKLDEQIAKKLAKELASPSTSNVAKPVNKKHGPMDKYLRQENAHASTGPQKKTISNFATKEYTCRVLCLDSNEKKPNVIQKASLSPMIMKKLQQLQKVVDTEVTSDSSDCIESELRYFKPIDHRINPRSYGKLPIKIPTRKPVCNSPVTLLSPTGMIKFQSNFLESAFARIPCSTPSTGAKDEERSPQPTSSSTTTPSKSLKRVHSEDCSSDKRNSKKKCSEEYDDKESPTIRSSKETAKRQLHKKPNAPHNEKNGTIKKNGIVKGIIEEEEKTKRSLQEMADLEFAKRLQDEFNREMHYTRSSRRSTAGAKRQTTLDKIIKTSYKVK